MNGGRSEPNGGGTCLKGSKAAPGDDQERNHNVSHSECVGGSLAQGSVPARFGVFQGQKHMEEVLTK